MIEADSRKRGFGALEILFGAALIVAVAIGLLTTFSYLAQLSQSNLRAAQATLLVTEGAEVARLWRDAGWVNLADLTPGTDYALVFNGGQWATTSAPLLIDGRFDRRLRVAEVYRDGTDNIAPGGTLDPETRLVAVTVAWRGPNATSTRSVSFYLTNLFAQ